MLYYWFLFNLYIIRIPFVESVSAVSDSQQLDNNVIELNETLVAIDNHSLPVNKIDKCKICVVFLEDLKLVINGTASPVVSQMMMERCEDKVGNKIVFEPVCELVLRELVRVLQWISSKIHPDNICSKLHICA